MNKDLDKLHFFEDISLSKYNKLARCITYVNSFIRAFGLNKMFAGLCLTSEIFVTIALARVLRYFLGISFSPILAVIIFLIVTLVYIYVSLNVAGRISSRFRCKLTQGIKDSFFFLAALNAYAICFFWSNPVSAFAISTVFAGAFLLMFKVYYEKKIAIKKQPDLDIPGDIDGECPPDVNLLSKNECKKIQINGDTRDAFLLDNNDELLLEMPADNKCIKFSIGMREIIPHENQKNVVLEVLNDENVVVYSKALNSFTDRNARNWIDVDLNLNKNNDDKKTALKVRTRSEDKDKKTICFSGPRKSGINAPKKIILIVLDAVRSDHVGCYGYGRGITPNIDKLAKDSTCFRNAMVQGDWTLPSFMSILTGKYPSSHNVYQDTVYHALDKGTETLPQALRKNGFITRSYFTHKRLMSHFGFASGFDSHLFRQCDRKANRATADDVTDRALDMLEFHKDDNLFLMLHYFDTHQPCDPPAPYSEMFDKTYGKEVKKNIRQILMDRKDEKFDLEDLDNLIARYDEEILRVDLKIGTIVDFLKSSGAYDDATIIVTADHGMLLNDHGTMTAIKLYDEMVRVPFIIKYPFSNGTQRGHFDDKTFVGASIDIMPTILDTYGIQIPVTVQGESIKENCEVDAENYSISESLFAGAYTASIRDESFRYSYKTFFDVSDFKNYKLSEFEETLFCVSDSGPEVAVNVAEYEDVCNKYRVIVESHIEDMLDTHKAVK